MPRSRHAARHVLKAGPDCRPTLAHGIYLTFVSCHLAFSSRAVVHSWPSRIVPAGQGTAVETGEDFIQGVIKFNGDGTLTLTEKGIYRNHGGSFPGSVPITTYADICSGKYQVNADLSFTYEVDCTTTFITGFFTGQTVSVSGLKYEGQLNRWLDSYIATEVSNAVQTQHFSDGHTNQRVCGGHSTALRIPW